MPAEIRPPRRPASLDLWYPPYPLHPSSSSNASASTSLGGQQPQPVRVRFPAPLPYVTQRIPLPPPEEEEDEPDSPAGEEGADGRIDLIIPARDPNTDTSSGLGGLRLGSLNPLGGRDYIARSSANSSTSRGETRGHWTPGSGSSPGIFRPRYMPMPVSYPSPPHTPPRRVRRVGHVELDGVNLGLDLAREREEIDEDIIDEDEEAEEEEEEEDDILFRASLRTGSNARLRRRGAIRLSLQPQDDPTLPSSPPSPICEKGEPILCGRGWASGQRLPNGARGRPEPVGGCGGLVHKRVRMEEGSWVAGENDKPEDGLVQGLRRGKRMGCGCEVALLGCTVCGTPLGTHTTHLCKLHSLRNSPAYKARYRFLPSRVFPASAPLLPPLAAVLPSPTDLAFGPAASKSGPQTTPRTLGEDPEAELQGFTSLPPSPRGSVLVFDPNGEAEPYPSYPQHPSNPSNPSNPSYPRYPTHPPHSRYPTFPTFPGVPRFSLPGASASAVDGLNGVHTLPGEREGQDGRERGSITGGVLRRSPSPYRASDEPFRDAQQEEQEEQDGQGQGQGLGEQGEDGGVRAAFRRIEEGWARRRMEEQRERDRARWRELARERQRLRDREREADLERDRDREREREMERERGCTPEPEDDSLTVPGASSLSRPNEDSQLIREIFADIAGSSASQALLTSAQAGSAAPAPAPGAGDLGSAPWRRAANGLPATQARTTLPLPRRAGTLYPPATSGSPSPNPTPMTVPTTRVISPPPPPPHLPIQEPPTPAGYTLWTPPERDPARLTLRQLVERFRQTLAGEPVLLPYAGDLEGVLFAADDEVDEADEEGERAGEFGRGGMTGYEDVDFGGLRGSAREEGVDGDVEMEVLRRDEAYFAQQETERERDAEMRFGRDG